ncbi:MAG: putative metallopeptidase [Clostridia bacterium]
MAKEKPMYEVVNDFSDIASSIIEKYPEMFAGIDIEKVKCVKITNKDRPESKSQRWEVDAVKMPALLDSPYAYYFTVWHSDWEEMDSVHKQLLVAEMLHSIPQKDDSEGKVNANDVKGYASMIRTFGVDYLDNPDAKDILTTDVLWIK